MGTAPLADVRVVEFVSFVAGPFCGMNLAQLGADVVRIDPVGGGPDRDRWPLADGSSLYWAGLNRGKRSVTLDLRGLSTIDAIRELLGESGDPRTGIIVTNSNQDWIQPTALRGIRDDVISVHITGMADGRPAVDYTVNAEVGFPLATGPLAPTDPTNHVLPAWDLLTGMHAVTAVATALRHRDRTGEGQHVTVSLEDVAFAATAALGFLSEPWLSGTTRDPTGNFLYGAFGRDFVTADGGRLMIVALTTRQWRHLVAVTGVEDIVGRLSEAMSADFEDEGVRFEHCKLLAEVIAPWFANRTTQEALDGLGATSVLTGRYRTFGEAASHGLSTGTLIEVNQPGIGRIPLGRQPLRFSSLQTIDNGTAPQLGQHTSAVLGRSDGGQVGR